MRQRNGLVETMASPIVESTPTFYCNSKDKQYEQLFRETTTTAMFDNLCADGCGCQYT